MDEWTLNDLLECSVCLERLDTSSKVLPCQHTFCKKCLEEIVTTHKELRCPECRILVDCSVEELPPNVLLMRILEGMKNAGNLVPKKKITPQKQPLLQNSATQNSSYQAYNNDVNFKPPNSVQKQNHIPTQPHGRAICDYLSKESRDLSFRKGEIIFLHKKVDAQWFLGECGGKTGIFPSSYVQVIIPLPDQLATCKALYDFRMVNNDDEGCLSFRKDDVITVIRRVDENWAEGKLNENIGIFPLAFVEMNLIAQTLMKISINQPGPSRIAPPTPTTEESVPLISSDHSGATSNHINQHPSNQINIGSVSQHNSPTKVQALVPIAVTGSESGSTVSSSTTTPSSSSLTPNSSSNTSSNSNSEPNSPPSNQAANNPNPFLPASQSPWPMILQTSHITNSAHGVLPTSHILGQQFAVGSDQLSGAIWTSPQRRDISDFIQHLKEKRHSFSAVSTNHHHCFNSNKHGIDGANSDSTSDIQNGQLIRHGSQKHKRSGSDKTSAVNLPAGYVALYPYKPQKGDELELKKGGIYFVTERCQDGWFKGTSSKTQKAGMFPGNYVTPVKPCAIPSQSRGTTNREATTHAPTPKLIPQSKSVKMPQIYGRQLVPPELPPRASSPSGRLTRIPAQNSSTLWHPSQNEFSNTQKSSAESTTTLANATTSFIGLLPDSRTTSSASTSSVSSSSVPTTKTTEKMKDKKEKSGLIKRLTTMKRSKSPPASASYSMDNPVFDDASASSLQVSPHSHPAHSRSGSCPSQLIRVNSEGGPNHRTFSASVSARFKHRERPSVSNQNFTQSTSRPAEATMYPKTGSTATGSSHRKSNSLDAGDATRKPRQLVPPVRERFRCIVPYPPNTEYELELKVGDIIYVHKKRDDGWYKGTQQRTGRTGLFPASFVETC